MTATPIIPPQKQYFWTLAYPSMPRDTRMPAMTIVITETEKMPVLVPNHAASMVVLPTAKCHLSRAKIGWNSWTDRMFP